MKKNPTISIIVPAFNEEKHIAQCLTSLNAQDYPKDQFEIIVIDNNSLDKTSIIAKENCSTVLKKIGGPVGAVRNFGVSVCSGDIIMFIDADCVAPNSWVSYAASRLKNNDTLVLGGGCKLKTTPHWLEKYWLLEGNEGEILPKDLLGSSIALHRTAFINAGQFNESITSGEDTELSEKLTMSGHSIEILREMSVVHLGNAESISKFFNRQIWHSENYFQNLRGSIKDITFILVLLYTINMISMPIHLFLKDISAITLGIIVFLVIPAIFSAKRIFRTRTLKWIKQLPIIYFIDFLYINGRSIGLIKSLFRLIKKEGN